MISLPIFPQNLHPIVHAAIEHIAQLSSDYSFMQDKLDEGTLQVFHFELPQAFEYARDPQVVVRGSVEVAEPFLVVRGTLQFTWKKREVTLVEKLLHYFSTSFSF